MAEKQADTGDYSATKAPENREHVESTKQTFDPKLTPGGPNAAPVDVGMEALDRDAVPKLAAEDAERDHLPAKDHRD